MPLNDKIKVKFYRVTVPLKMAIFGTNVKIMLWSVYTSPLKIVNPYLFLLKSFIVRRLI